MRYAILAAEAARRPDRAGSWRITGSAEMGTRICASLPVVRAASKYLRACADRVDHVGQRNLQAGLDGLQPVRSLHVFGRLAEGSQAGAVRGVGRSISRWSPVNTGRWMKVTQTGDARPYPVGLCPPREPRAVGATLEARQDNSGQEPKTLLDFARARRLLVRRLTLGARSKSDPHGSISW